MIVVTYSVHHFDLDKIADSGQTFRWRKLGRRDYLIPAAGIAARAWQPDKNTLCIKCQTEQIPWWRHYFALDMPYQEYWKIIEYRTKKDGPSAYLTKAVEFSDGIVILNQDPWEAAASFVISQCNNIPRIKRIIETLCGEYGNEIKTDIPGHKTVRGFPKPENLRNQKDLRRMGLGYRDKYMVALASSYKEAEIYGLRKLETRDARAELLKTPGIGPKVANCILLFGLGHIEAFPQDVWIKRILKREFQDGFPFMNYPGFAGLIQQFIFYYEREGRK